MEKQNITPFCRFCYFSSMNKLLLPLMVLQVFNSCTPIVKKQNFTIDYLKSNKWCTMEVNHIRNSLGELAKSYYDSIQTCHEFDDNEIKSFKNGKLNRVLEFIFKQKSDNLIAVKSIQEGSTIFSYYRMKSLDTISLFHSSAEGVYDDKTFVFDFVRVK